MTKPISRPISHVPGKAEVRWRLIVAIFLNCGLWAAIFFTAKGCIS